MWQSSYTPSPNGEEVTWKAPGLILETLLERWEATKTPSGDWDTDRRHFFGSHSTVLRLALASIILKCSFQSDIEGPSLLTSKLTATTHGWATQPVMLGAGPAHQQTHSSYISQSLMASLPACPWYLAPPQEKDPCSYVRNIPGGSILMTRRKYDIGSHRMSPT